MGSKGWNLYKLGQIADIQTGPFGSQLHQKDYVPFGTPIITVEHLGENYLIHEKLPRISNEDKQRLIKYTLQEGDIIFSRVGSVDRRAIVKKAEEGWLFSGRCLRVRAKSQDLNTSYLSYFFGLESFKEHIRAIAVGSTMPSLNTSILSEIEIPLPPLPTQRRIADILSSLDDKIELNRQTNATLEAIAQAIFKEWFVDFNYPGAPGEMVESELGPIPNGWNVGKLEDFVKISSGKGLQKKEFVETGYPVLGANGSIGYTDKYLLDEEVILTGRVGTLGTFQLVNDRVWISDNVLILRPIKKENYYFSYFGVKTIDFRNLNRGSTQPLVTKTDLLNQQLLIPDSSTLLMFDIVCRALFNHIENNKQQSSTLTTIRDTLIPKLMNGEIDA
jgi:type I restriction enzyme, S subunit